MTRVAATPRAPRLLVACAGALLASLLSAASASSYEVRVDAVSADGSEGVGSVRIDLAELSGSEDVTGRSYEVRYEGGQVESETVTGFSLLLVLEEARDRDLEIDPKDFRLITIAAPTGSRTVLESEVDGNGNGPPVIFDDDGATTFLRPLKDGADTNVEDRLQGAGGLILEVRPREDADLSSAAVEIAAAVDRDERLVPLQTSDPPVEVDVGEQVTFTGRVEGGPPGALDYSWSFGDDRSGETGQRVTHAFRKPGSYGVVVLATSAGGGDLQRRRPVRGRRAQGRRARPRGRRRERERRRRRQRHLRGHRRRGRERGVGLRRELRRALRIEPRGRRR